MNQLGASHNAQNFKPRTLPTKAPALWKNDKEKGDTPPNFIRRHYSPWIPGLSRGELRKLDPDLYQALYNWLKRNEMPDDLDLPTRAQVTTNWIERVEGSESPILIATSPLELRRFADAVARRSKKAPQK
ncbi:MAG: hypothetical protein JOZ13_17340 [Alphaproteobacteria bacterium]|nr:hypothetical protein [Alphaproteobacteria bacterium]